MRIVAGGGGDGESGVGEEAVVEKGGFEDEVDERVEEVPNVEGAKARGCAGGQELGGG